MSEEQAGIGSQFTSESAEKNRPSLLWMARSILFRDQLNRKVELPVGANWYTRMAIKLENPPKKYGNLICDIAYTVDFIAFSLLWIDGNIMLKVVSVIIGVVLTTWLASINLIWAWYGGGVS